MLDENENRVKELKRKFKSADVSFDLMVLLTSVIDTVDGIKMDQNRLEGFVDKLPAMDMTKIVNAVDELNAQVGLDNDLIIDCNKCGGEVHTSFRFGSEFFRPTNI
jgi:hypothetical protein